MLLVTLPERQTELEATLMATSPFGGDANPAGQASGLAFKTEARDIQSVLAESRSARQQVGTGGLPPDLLFRDCFVVPARKREGSTSLFSERITVGRARNHDIVLRHRSVSKFHAWLEKSPEGSFLVADAGSSNHTMVDGERCDSHPVALRSGAKIRFGSIEAYFAPLDALLGLLAPFGP